MYITYMTESSHVVPKPECATLYSCFRLVGHHQQGIAHSAYGTPGFIGPDALRVHVHELHEKEGKATIYTEQQWI